MQTTNNKKWSKIKASITYFFTKIFWLIKELIKALSSKDSFFSKKRVESAVAFLIAQWGMVYYLNSHITTLSVTDFLMWVSVEFFVAGYIINKIEESKVNRFKNKHEDEENHSDADNV